MTRRYKDIFFSHIKCIGTYPLSSLLFLLTLLIGAFVSYLIFFRLNFLQIDLAGHMASAMSLLSVGFHGYQDRFFQGYVQNLFYPPLEDFILALFYKVFNFDFEMAFKTYLFLLTWGLLSTILKLSFSFKEDRARAALLLSFLFLLSLSKPGLLHFQGLSFFDLLVTGLSSQILGGIFFLLLCHEILNSKRPHFLGALMFLVILSHLVMAVVAFLVLLFHLFSENKRSIPEVFLWVLATSFFSVPFLSFKKYLVSANIFGRSEWKLFLFSVVGVFLFRKTRLLGFFGVGALLLLPSVLGNKAEFCYPQSVSGTATCITLWEPFTLPVFHYYRFTMPVIYLLVLACCSLLQEQGNQRRSLQTIEKCFFFTGVFLLFFGSGLGLQTDLSSKNREFQAAELQISNTFLQSHENELQRIWTLEDSRSIGFGIDCYTAMLSQNTFFNMGLFWESSKNNMLLSSYLATLLSKTSVLDYYFFENVSCDSMACLVDSMIQDQGLKGILYPSETTPSYLSPEKAKCFRDIFRNGTQAFSFKKEKGLKANQITYDFWKIIPRNSTYYNYLTPVEVVDPEELVFYRSTVPDYFNVLAGNRMSSCVDEKTKNNLVFVSAEGSEKLRGLIQSVFLENRSLSRRNPGLTFQRIQSGEYRIEVSQPDDPVFFRIKLNYYPGLMLRDSQGDTPPFAEGLSGLIAYGKGTFTLKWEKPFIFYFSYFLSGLAAIAILVQSWIKKRR